MAVVNRESPYRSRKLWAASLAMLFITLVALSTSPHIGVDKELAEYAINGLAVIALAVLGAQGLVDHIKAKNGHGK